MVGGGSTTMSHLRCCLKIAQPFKAWPVGVGEGHRDFVKRRDGFFQGEANEGGHILI